MRNPIESVLENDHASLGELLTKLEVELAKHSHERSFELLDLFWARLAVHIRAEHLHLFPALIEVAKRLSGKAGMPILEEVKKTLERLRTDHDVFMTELAQLMKEARVNRAATGSDDFRKRLTAIRKRLETHNQIEENQVYIWPSQYLDETTLAALKGRLRHELENMPPRFASETL